jgi:asparaginyl-tRNA synthetase
MYTTIKQIMTGAMGWAALRGWAARLRGSGGVAFVDLRDGTGHAQLVFDRSRLSDADFARAKSICLETPLEAEGEVVWRGEAFELIVDRFEALPSETGFPLGRKEHGPDYLMDKRHLWIRSPRQAAILRIRDSLEWACVSFLREEGFYRFDSPLITPTACEGTTELFELGYFGASAYLSQSAQLYSEAGIAALGKVYSLGPCFRAEKSMTRRHLTEFWGVEPEMAWVRAEESIAFQERFLRAILERVSEDAAGDLASLGRDPAELRFPPSPFPILSYDDALASLARLGRVKRWGEDLSVEDEEALSLRFDTPFFVYKYPVECRAFYIEPDPDDPSLALSSDCLMHGGFGEIITGGQRASDAGFLAARIEEHGLRRGDFEWYLDLRRWGGVPHSGFGMGIERMLRWICGLHHIREAIPFARTPSRFAP